MRNEFRQVERLRGMKCFPDGSLINYVFCNSFTWPIAQVDIGI